MAEKKIGSKTFKTEPLLATEAIKLQARLLKVVAPALDRLPAILAGRAKGDEDASNGAAISAFMDIFARSEADDLMTLVKDVCEVAMVKRPSGAYDQVDFDGDFTGNLKEIVPVAVFVLQEQFGDFFRRRPGEWQPKEGRGGLNEHEVRRVAPNLNLMLWRPMISEPPMFTMRDLRSWVTLNDLLDAHEALDLKAAMHERASDK